MDTLVEYVSIGVRIGEHCLFDAINAISELRVTVKVYLILLHLFCLSLLFVGIKLKSKGRVFTAKERTRSILVGDVRVESCDWVNSTLEWFFHHSLSHRTPALIRFWINALNRQLCKDQKKGQKVVIEDLCPGCLPPNLMNVYCVCNSGNLQCITFQVKSKELRFFVAASQSTSNGPSSTKLKLDIKLKGEVSLKMSAGPKSLQTAICFNGNPEIHISTTVLQKDGSEPPSVETIEEKVKDVICKTVTNIQLQKDESVKEKPLSPSAESCLGCKGKLLIKVIKATELQGKVKNAPISPYCVIYSDNPVQRKRTSMLKDDKNPFWNEYLAFDVSLKTKEITFDLYDYDKTSPEMNCHLDETEPAMEEDDFLGQVVVPLATVNSNQTCRMTMPVLPKSYKSEYAHGQLYLEFTFDKDGKVMDSAIPLIADQAKFVEQTVGVSQTQIENSQKENGSSPGDATEVTVNGYQETSLNGYVMGTSGYLETSLDDLAHEIELYEAGELHQLEQEKSEARDQAAKSVIEAEEQREEPDAGGVPSGGLDEGVVIVEVTEETKVIEEPEQEKQEEPLEENELNEEKEPEVEKDQEPESGGKTKKRFKLGSSLRRRKKEKQEEDKMMEQPQTPESIKGEVEQETEPKQNKKWFKRGQSSKTKQEALGQETEQKQESVSLQAEPEVKVKPSRWSLRKKNSKSSKKGSSKKENEQAAESVTSEQPLDVIDVTKTEESTGQSPRDGTEEEVKTIEAAEPILQEKPLEQEVPSKEDQAEIVVDTSPSPISDKPADEGTEESKENSDTVAEFKKPPKRRLFSRNRSRPASVAITDSTPEQRKEKPLARENPTRHSYHGGDLDHSNRQRRDSETSVLSYAPNAYSTLVMEVTENGDTKLFIIPKSIDNRKCYDIRGTKLHVYNDHTFVDTNFTESLKCDVCDNAISGILSKRGYECRDCKMRVHKRCHFQTSVMCASSTLKEKTLIRLPEIYGHCT